MSKRASGSTMPCLFISHGAPTLAIDESPAHRFLRGFGDDLPRPSAVVVFSAHFETGIATVTASPQPETVHDFGGFDRSLYEIEYPAPGHPDLAARIAELLEQGGVPVHLDDRRGLDHGVWVPLSLMYPDADIPVLQVSIDPGKGTRYHYDLGSLLAPLSREGVLIVGSGSATHNLRSFFSGSEGDTVPRWVAAFNEWLAERITGNDLHDLLHYAERGPYARDNHPTAEHYLPLLCALGAAGESARSERVHASYDRGVLSMDVYRILNGAG